MPPSSNPPPSTPLGGIAALVPLTFRAVAGTPTGRWLLVAGLCAGTVALGTTRFPETARGNLGRTSFETTRRQDSDFRRAYQADVARHATAPLGTMPKLPTKEVTASTWMLGTFETLAVIAVMVLGYWISGRIARRRRQQNAAGWAR